MCIRDRTSWQTERQTERNCENTRKPTTIITSLFRPVRYRNCSRDLTLRQKENNCKFTLDDQFSHGHRDTHTHTEYCYIINAVSHRQCCANNAHCRCVTELFFFPVLFYYRFWQASSEHELDIRIIMAMIYNADRWFSTSECTDWYWF